MQKEFSIIELYGHMFKDFDFVTHYSVLSDLLRTCKKIQKKDKTYDKKIYDETINLAFRPKVRIDDICLSVLKYISTSLRVEEKFPLYAHDEVQIISHIHVDDDDDSMVSIMTPEILEQIGIYDTYGFVGKSETSMVLPYKMDFLTETEERLLLGISDSILESPNKTTYDFTYGQLIEIIKADEYETKILDSIDDMLNTLIFYEFITVDQKNVFKEDGTLDEHYFIISLCDAENLSRI